METNHREITNLLNSQLSNISTASNTANENNVIEHHVIELNESSKNNDIIKTEDILLNLRLFEAESNKVRHEDGQNKILTFLMHQNNEKFPREKFLNELFGYTGNSYKIQPELFQKLFNILNDNSKTEYHEICLEAVYLHFHDINIDFDNEDIENLIERALRIKNQEYGIEILKILFVFLRASNSQSYKDLKQKTLANIKRSIFSASSDSCGSGSTCKSSYKEMKKVCNHQFFNLLFLLKENYVQKFKVEYKKFVKYYKQCFGEYWIYEIKRNGQILCLVADFQNLYESKEFLILKTKESDLKASIMSSFTRVAEFQAVFRRPLKNNDKKLLDKISNIVESNFSGEGNDIDSDNFKNIFRNTPEIRKLLFGRPNLKAKSLFEEILSKFDSKQSFWNENFFAVLNYIWNEFRLWIVPEIWTMKNPSQKRLLDYVLDTDNDSYIIAFLMLKESDKYEELHEPNHFMMLKNSLLREYQNDNSSNSVRKGLIEYHLSLIDKNERNDYENTKNLFYFFEEINQFSKNQNGNADFFIGVFKRILTEEPEIFDGDHEPKLPRKHFWIGILMIYLGYFVEFESIDENGTKNTLIVLKNLKNQEEVLKFEAEFIPYLHLLSLILNKKVKEFAKQFPKEIVQMEESYKNIYQLPNTYDNQHQKYNEIEIFNFYEKYSTNFSFILLYAAIKTDQKKIVNIIFDYNNFLICCPEFPQNMIVSDIHHYTAQMFLENKYELGRGELPKNWMNRKTLEDFLDSRITCQNNFYKIDCQFMLPYFNHDEKPEVIDDGVIANEDYETMDYILNDHDLRSLVTHPVMETIIRTKIQKYARIFFWNLIGFILFYVIPTIWLVSLIHSKDNSESKSEDEIDRQTDLELLRDNLLVGSGDFSEKLSDASSYEYSTEYLDENVFNNERKDAVLPTNISGKNDIPKNWDWIVMITVVRLLFLVPREWIQFAKVYKQKYYSKLSNWLETGLIILPLILLMLIWIFKLYKDVDPDLMTKTNNNTTDTDEEDNLKYLNFTIILVEALNVLLMIIASFSLYPALKFSIYMKCLQTIFCTYLMAFILFLPLFFGCIALAYILFDQNVGGQIDEFRDFGNASTKYLIMYAGEIDMKSENLSGIIQVFAMTIIIILIINKANLILSVVVNDVQNIMDKSKEYSLRLYAARYVEFAEKIFYATEIESQNNISWMTRFLFEIVKLFTKKYPHLHQVHKLYVDKKFGYVHIDDRRPLFEASVFCPNFIRKSRNSVVRFFLKYWDQFFSHLELDSDTMEKIQKIIKKRYENKSRDDDASGQEDDDDDE
ncbi:uncharacterized protein [Chironomus tepperi]|uniref:uncharacterized protein n=1 Tax=Chironomus tepperi TaxID=113505 RepID=UPI00391F3587